MHHAKTKPVFKRKVFCTTSTENAGMYILVAIFTNEVLKYESQFVQISFAIYSHSIS